MQHDAYIRKPENANRALLMIHGICGTPRHFDFLLPAFDQSWAVYNILLDGHGSSVQDFAHSSMEKWKAQTAAMLDLLSSRYDRILVIGHSMGSLLLLRQLPHYSKICGCVLFNPPMLPFVRPRMLPQALRLAFGKPKRSDMQFLRDTSITLSRNLFSYLGWLPRYWELLTLCRQCRKRAAHVPVPSLVYFGTSDELVSIGSKRYFESDPLVQLSVLENTGHFGFTAETERSVLSDIHCFIHSIF